MLFSLKILAIFCSFPSGNIRLEEFFSGSVDDDTRIHLHKSVLCNTDHSENVIMIKAHDGNSVRGSDCVYPTI